MVSAAETNHAFAKASALKLVSSVGLSAFRNICSIKFRKSRSKNCL